MARPQSATASTPPKNILRSQVRKHDSDPDAAPPSKAISPFAAAAPESPSPASAYAAALAAHPNPVPPNSPATKPSKFSPPAPPLSRASRDFPASPSHLLSNPESRSCIPSRPSSATFLHTSAPRHPDAPQSLIRPISFRSSPHRRGL